MVFEGFLVFSPAVAKHIPELLYRFSEHHIRVTLFVGVEPDTRYYASFAGFGEPTSGDASRTAFRMIPAEDPAKSAKLYEDRLRAAGKRTLVLSVENSSLELIRGADIAVTCDPIGTTTMVFRTNTIPNFPWKDMRTATGQGNSCVPPLTFSSAEAQARTADSTAFSRRLKHRFPPPYI